MEGRTVVHHPDSSVRVVQLSEVSVYKVIDVGSGALKSYDVGKKRKSDWSGLYTQFGREHVLGTIPYRWEAGHSEALLIRATFAELNAVVFSGGLFHDAGVRGEEKAAVAKRLLGVASDSPLMEALGQKHQAALVRESSDEWELVFPHGLLQHLRYSERVVARFRRHKQLPVILSWCREADVKVWKRWSLDAEPEWIPDLKVPVSKTHAEGLFQGRAVARHGRRRSP